MASKESVVFFTSETLAEIIKATAQERDMSASALVNQAVAVFLDYDLDAEPRTMRAHKYANKAERDKAMRERAKEKRQKTKAMMDAIKRGETQEAIMALARRCVYEIVKRMIALLLNVRVK